MTYRRALSREEGDIIRRLRDDHNNWHTVAGFDHVAYAKAAVLFAMVLGYCVWHFGIFSLPVLVGYALLSIFGGIAYSGWAGHRKSQPTVRLYSEILERETVEIEQYACSATKKVFGYEGPRVIRLFALDTGKTLKWEECTVAPSIPTDARIVEFAILPATGELPRGRVLLRAYHGFPGIIEYEAYFDEDEPLANIGSGTMLDLSIEEYIERVS